MNAHFPLIQPFEAFEAETLKLLEPPFRSKFGAFRWSQIFEPAQPYDWLIKNIIPMREAVLIYGAPQTGKSFETQNMALHIARGLEFGGNRVRKAGVVYCAFEGGKGFRNRQKAYALHHHIAVDDDLDMIVLTRRADLFSSDTDINDLIAEIRHWASTFKSPLGLVVMDTWSAATPGANENAGEDVSRVKAKVMRVIEECSCSVVVVHHKPAAGGKPRGHSSLTGDFETTIDIDWVQENLGRETIRVKDSDGRPIRMATITKQREGEQGLSWKFTLRQVRIGKDADGDDMTSCVSTVPAGAVDEPKPSMLSNAARMSEDGRWFLKPNLETAMRSLTEALARKGRKAPDNTRVPNASLCVTLSDWRDEWERIAQSEDENPDQLKARVKKARDRAIERLLPTGFLGKDGDWVWRTGKRVFNVDPEIRRRKPAELPSDADDIEGLPF